MNDSSKQFLDEFIVSIASFKSSSVKHDVHFVSRGLILNEIMLKWGGLYCVGTRLVLKQEAVRRPAGSKHNRMTSEQQHVFLKRF